MEEKFLTELKHRTSDNKNFAIFTNVVNLVLSSPKAKFIKTLENIAFDSFSLDGDKSESVSACFSLDGNYIISGLCNGQINLLDLRNKNAPTIISTLTCHGELFLQ